MTASGGLEEFQDEGLKGKPIKTTASTFYPQEILFLVCTYILLNNLLYFTHINRPKSQQMSLIYLFKPVLVII